VAAANRERAVLSTVLTYAEDRLAIPGTAMIGARRARPTLRARAWARVTRDLKFTIATGILRRSIELGHAHRAPGHKKRGFRPILRLIQVVFSLKIKYLGR